MSSNNSSKKVFYITLNDAPGGIFQSQVIDVIKLYRDHQVNANLIAFISIRGFWKQRKTIKRLLASSIVLPAFPRLKYWNLNKIWFPFLSIPANSIIIARNIFACNLVLAGFMGKRKIIYDGRGSISAEQEEYNVYASTGLENQIALLEQQALFKSDKRIAVSTELLNYWKSEYHFSGVNTSIIPCTTSYDFSRNVNNERSASIKSELNIAEDELVFVYSGSIAEWQSFNKLEGILQALLKVNPTSKLLFLAKEHPLINDLINDFPGRVYQRFVKHNDVVDYLDICDYGILLREDSVTNRVASPVKCAEYLSRGLKVLISPSIGDYSREIKQHDLGYILQMDQSPPTLNKVEKQGQVNYAKKHLMKSADSIIKKYMDLLVDE